MKKSVAIIGGGSAALMLACELDNQKFDVTIYEKNKALGRKFLVAGDGGLNITHSEEIDKFITRYRPSGFIDKYIHQFSNNDLRLWLKAIGIETYIGSSKRVFPAKGIKPIEVLNSILLKLKNKNVEIKTEHKWLGWDTDGSLLFSFQEKTIVAKPDYIVYALGGASWPVTGSDGDWLNLFSKRRITTIPFESSNCAVCCNWNNSFLKIADGTFLKNIVLKFNGIEKAGELVITKSGMEGGVVYALNYAIREELKNKENAVLHIDLKPVFSVEQIENTLANKKNKSITHQLKSVLKLSETAIALLQFTLSKHEFSIPKILAFSIKNLPIKIHYLASIEDSISTVGGISLDEISVAFELKKIKNNFVIGEMLNWDAPTGGYLLQGCFSMANYIAHYLNTKKT